ncbi:unnamed protein product, partial [marine sediment metagenome]
MRKYLVYAIMAGLVIFLSRVTIFSAEKSKEDIYRLRREKMVADQIVARGVKDEKVLLAMGTVPRHKFVSEDLINSAYEDRPLPI